MNHSPRADFDPSVHPDAATIYAELAVRKLEALARLDLGPAAAADQRAPHHDRGRAVGVVVRTAVDLDEALAGSA